MVPYCALSFEVGLPSRSAERSRYILGGVGIGAVLAIEMAMQLGSACVALILLDPRAPRFTGSVVGEFRVFLGRSTGC